MKESRKYWLRRFRLLCRYRARIELLLIRASYHLYGEAEGERVFEHEDHLAIAVRELDRQTWAAWGKSRVWRAK